MDRNPSSAFWTEFASPASFKISFASATPASLEIRTSSSTYTLEFAIVSNFTSGDAVARTCQSHITSESVPISTSSHHLIPVLAFLDETNVGIKWLGHACSFRRKSVTDSVCDS